MYLISYEIHAISYEIISQMKWFLPHCLCTAGQGGGWAGGFNSWHNNIYGSGWRCVDCRGSRLEGFCSVILGAICNDTTIFSCLGRCFFISDCLCGSFCFCGLSGDFCVDFEAREYFGSNFNNKKHFGMINSFTFFTHLTFFTIKTCAPGYPILPMT